MPRVLHAEVAECRAEGEAVTDEEFTFGITIMLAAIILCVAIGAWAGFKWGATAMTLYVTWLAFSAWWELIKSRKQQP